MSTGLALEPAQAYARALEKGVLLGPTHYATAAEMFAAAARALATAGAGLSARTKANSHLYAFFARRDFDAASSAARQLAGTP
jgi:hypothetical protein